MQKEQDVEEKLLEPGRSPRFPAEETLPRHWEGYAEHRKPEEKDIEGDKREGAGWKADDERSQCVDSAEYPACRQVYGYAGKVDQRGFGASPYHPREELAIDDEKARCKELISEGYLGSSAHDDARNDTRQQTCERGSNVPDHMPTPYEATGYSHYS